MKANAKAIRVYLPETWNFKTFMIDPNSNFRELRSLMGQKLKFAPDQSLGFSFYCTSDVKSPKIIDLNELVVKLHNREIAEDESFKIIFAPIGFHPTSTYAEYMRKQKDRVKAIEEIEKLKSQSQPSLKKQSDDFRPILPGQANSQRMMRPLNAVRATAILSEGIKSEDGSHEEEEEEEDILLESEKIKVGGHTTSNATFGVARSQQSHVSSATLSPSSSSSPSVTATSGPISSSTTSPLPQTENVEAEKLFVIAIYDCNANGKPNVLSFQKGEIIELLKTVNDNWSFGRLNGISGMFPSPYTRPYVPPISPNPTASTISSSSTSSTPTLSSSIPEEEEEEEEEEKLQAKHVQTKFFLKNLSLDGEEDIEVELFSGDNVLGRLNADLLITSTSVSRKQAILHIDEHQKIATILSMSDVPTHISRMKENSSERNILPVPDSSPITLLENDIVILESDSYEFLFYSKLVEEDELDQAALECQKEAALDDLAESCRSLLEQEKSLLLTEELKALCDPLPMAISQTLIFQLLAGILHQIPPEEIDTARTQYRLLYESFLRFRDAYKKKQTQMRVDLEAAVPDPSITESDRFRFLKSDEF